MNKGEVAVSVEAEEDIREIFTYLELNNPVAADGFETAINETLRRLAEWPYSAPEQRYVEDDETLGIHVSRVSRTFQHYLVFYRPDDTCITVIRVLHAARDIPRLLLESDD